MDSYWTEERICDRVKKFHTTEYSWRNIQNIPHLAACRKATVLVPLVVRTGTIYVWLTKRAAHLRNYGGNAAFPGGMRDPDDQDETATCLREAQEEIGLQTHQVNIIAQLLPKIHTRNISVTQVVGIVCEDFVPRIDTNEVEDAYCLPLHRFLKDERHTSELVSVQDKQYFLHWFRDDIEGKKFVTWGHTAMMCVELAMILFRQEPDFVWDVSGLNSLDDPFVLQKQRLAQAAENTTETVLSKL